MRTGISFTVSSRDRQRLQAIVAGPKSPQKQVWRARIVLLSGEGLGTSAIMAATGKAKTCVWRWQERFMQEGVDGLLHDKTRPPGKARQIVSRIRLRLTTGRKTPNPHDDLDNAVDRLRRALEGDKAADIDILCEKVVLHGKEVLKEAWEEAKSGR